MKKDTLGPEEQSIIQDFESGEMVSVPNLKREKTRYQQKANYTLKKAKSINIRLPERDLQHLKEIAAEKGLPYQTLISSLLHQYAAKNRG